MHKGVIWFLVLAFAGAWIPWEIGIGLGVAPTSPGFQLFAAIGACAPAAACFVVRKGILTQKSPVVPIGRRDPLHQGEQRCRETGDTGTATAERKQALRHPEH